MTNNLIEYLASRYNKLTKEDFKNALVETIATFWEDYEDKNNLEKFYQILDEILEEIRG